MASVRNPNRTDAPDPVTIDDTIERSLQDRGIPTSGPGYAKMPGAEMIVANPAYYDARDAQYQQQMAGQGRPQKQAAAAPQSTGTPAYDGRQPPRRPRDTPATGSANGQTDYSDASASGSDPDAQQAQRQYAEAPLPPTRPTSQGGTPEGQGPHDYTLPAAVAGVGGTALLGMLLARRMRGQGGEVPTNVMPPEASGGEAVDSFLKMANRQVPPNRQLAGPAETEAPRATGETIAAGDPVANPSRQLTAQTEPELIRPSEFNQQMPTVGEEPPTARRVGEAPQTRPGQATWDQPKGSVPDGGTEIPATREQVVTLDKSGLHVAKSDIDALIAKSLSDAAPGIRGGGARPRTPRATIK